MSLRLSLNLKTAYTGVVASDYAPGAVRAVQEFINTLDEDDESVGDPESLQRWLLDNGLLGPGVTVSQEEHARAIALREGLRTIVGAHHGDAIERGELQQLNSLAATVPLAACFGPDGSVTAVPAGDGFEAALGRILAAAFAGVAEGTWRRLKVCQADTCRWAFYDASKNRSGAWCSMRVCGNRAKVRAYQERRRKKSAES